MTEQWLPIPHWEGLYEISDHGRVLSVRTQRLRKLQTDKDGYQSITLHGGGIRRWYAIHTLVLITFVGAKPEGMEARHLNGKSGDNRRTNLEWATHLVNIRDKEAHGTVYQHLIDQCPAGHDYNEANTYRWTNERGKEERRCRTCHRDRMYARSKPGKRTTRSGKKLA